MAENIFVLTFGFIKTWQKSLLVAVLTMKNTFKQVLQVILRIYVIKLAAFYQRENECRVFCRIFTTYVHAVHGPKDQGSTSIKYNWSKIEKGITEWYHSHPTGAPIPSAADLSLLTSRYSGGYLDVNNFSYGVISVFGCTTFIIISEEDFKAFAESFSYDKMKEDLKVFVSKSGGVRKT